MHSNVTIKNVSWPHFSWATLYILVSAAIVLQEPARLLQNLFYFMHMKPQLYEFITCIDMVKFISPYFDIVSGVLS